ncbi:MAG: LD-carboxypeptidase [Chitinophagaceae bacterium]|nr:LD-carboxypeptidase [Chitinophagaceae bacterium]
MTIIPPYLKKGDTIGIVCPAGYMPYEKASMCIEVLQQWGYKVKVGNTLGSQFHYFSGTDEERLLDLQQMLDDDKVQAVLCGRGGYGMGRIIDRLNFSKFRKKPKWVIGFSDITVFHAHVYRRFSIAGIHAPMAAAFNDLEYKNDYVQSLKKVLAGKKSKYAAASHAYNKPGKVTGPLIGGNLSIIAHLAGTSSALKTKGHILFLEDVGEYIYNTDRMFYQLKRSGVFDDVAGVVIGYFTDMKDTVVPYGSDVYDVIRDVLQKYTFPVCYQFPVSHDTENYALKIGLNYQLTIGKNKVTLAEQ